MREIECAKITQAVRQMCIDACCKIPADVYAAIQKAKQSEKSELGKEIMGQILKNDDIAARDMVPICQDTGMTVVFVEIGQEVHIVGGELEKAINDGVAAGYTDGYLRKSVVIDPLYDRKNSGDNTPAVIHYKIVAGDSIKIRLAPKGAGSENKGILKMLVPADGIEGVKKVFLEAVKYAGPNSCPPLVIGVGIGGTMEKCAELAKIACARDVDSINPNPKYAALENELKELANKTGVGPQGLGGETTAIKVNVEVYATHIASLPVCVNINCHAARHAHCEL